MKFTHNNFCTANILLLSMDHEDDSNQKSEVCTELHLVSILLYTTLHLYMFRVANCPVFNRTVRYFGDLSGLKMKAKPDMHLSGIFVTTNIYFIFLTYISLFESFYVSNVPVFFK